MALIIDKEHINNLKDQTAPSGVFCSIPRTASNGMTVYLLDGYLKDGFESVRNSTDFYYADRFITAGHRKYNHFLTGHKTTHKGLKFATVRNTYDRLVSLCEHLVMRGNFKYADFRLTVVDKIKLFKKYLYLVKEVRDKCYYDEWGLYNALPQLMYLQDDGVQNILLYSKQNKYTLKKIKIGVDYLLQYETLAKDYFDLCTILKIPNKFGTWFATKSEREDTKMYYDLENKTIVEDLFGFEIEYFGYRL